MANSKQAIKRAKQNAETYKLRHAQRSMVRTAVKAVRASIDANDADKAKELLKSAEKIIDSSASKKVIHKNLQEELDININDIFMISAATGEGVNELLSKLETEIYKKLT